MASEKQDTKNSEIIEIVKTGIISQVILDKKILIDSKISLLAMEIYACMQRQDFLNFKEIANFLGYTESLVEKGMRELQRYGVNIGIKKEVL